MKIRPTGSKIHRVWKCPASAVLPQVENIEPRPAAGRGKAIHAFLERVRIVGHEQALGEIDDAATMLLCKAIDIDTLPTKLATEVAYAYDWHGRTARVLARNAGRVYAMPGALEALGISPLTTTEIPACFDLVGVQMIGDVRTGYAGDYKSGHTRYPSPERYGQTMLAALCLRAVYKLDEVFLELIHIHDDGTHHTVRRKVDEWEMDTFADEVAAAMMLVDHEETEHLAGRGVNAREGDHCDYCPAYAQCPAKIALVRSIPAEMAALGPEGGMSRVRAPEAWMTIERLEEILSHLKQEICNMAAVGGDIPLPDGRVIGRLVSERETLVGKVAHDVMAQWYGAEEAATAIEIKASKESVRHLVTRKLKPKEKVSTRAGDGMFDRILAEIRRRNGSTISRSDAVKPHLPRKKRIETP